MTGLSDRLSELTAHLDLEALPATVRRCGAEVLSGALVSAATGAALPALVEVRAVVDALAPGGDATVVGRPTPAGPYAAAFANATACRAVGSHPGAAVVPAALAMAEVCGAAPADLLAGVVAGLEVLLRVDRALGEAHRGEGWDVAGTAGHVGAAAAAARVARLPEDPTRAAMGIGATQAGGLEANHPTMAGACQVGKAAADGLEAALMAAEGIAGPLQPLEGRRGLLALASTAADPDGALAGIGQAWEVDRLAGADAARTDDGRSSPPGASLALLRRAAMDVERLGSLDELTAACRVAGDEGAGGEGAGARR